tara:strand:+ start:1772 stop:2764 length:993 start_codon:yes stop_codon:yes gene_type:complete
MGSKENNQWRVFKGSNEQWLEILKKYPEVTYLSDNEWANHLNNFGWKSLRIIKANQKKDSETLLQGFVKFFPFSTAFVWIPGGIIGNYENLNGLQQEIRKILKIRFCIIRVRFPQKYNISYEIELLKNNWVRPIVALSSNLKVFLKLNSIQMLKGNFSRSWFRSLKKSCKSDIKIIEIKSPNIISGLYKEMQNNKGLRQKDIYSGKQCKSIMDAFGKNLLIFGAQDKFNKICSIRAVIIRGNKLNDIFAATNNLGRLYFASHLILYKVFEKGIDLGCIEYDLSNVEPERSLGVYNFKKGTGGEIIQTLGEFEWTNSIALKLLLNLYCRFK